MIIDGILLALYTSYLNSGLDWGRGRSFLNTTEEREKKKVVGDNQAIGNNTQNYCNNNNNNGQKTYWLLQ